MHLVRNVSLLQGVSCGRSEILKKNHENWANNESVEISGKPLGRRFNIFLLVMFPHKLVNGTTLSDIKVFVLNRDMKYRYCSHRVPKTHIPLLK